MPSDMRYGVAPKKFLQQLGEAGILSVFKRFAFQSFEFDADRIVVAIAATAIVRNACMPGTCIAVHELPYRAIALDIEMARNLKTSYTEEVGVQFPVQHVGEQGVHMAGSIDARRQADRMDHHQVDRDAQGAGAKIR